MQASRRAHKELGREQLSSQGLVLVQQLVTLLRFSKFHNCTALKHTATLSRGWGSFPFVTEKQHKTQQLCPEAQARPLAKRHPASRAPQPARLCKPRAAPNPAPGQPPAMAPCCSAAHTPRSLHTPFAIETARIPKASCCAITASEHVRFMLFLRCSPENAEFFLHLLKHQAISNRHLGFFSAPSTSHAGDSQSLPYTRAPGTSAAVNTLILIERFSWCTMSADLNNINIKSSDPQDRGCPHSNLPAFKLRLTYPTSQANY